MKAKVGISALLGRKPHQITLYAVQIGETKYRQSGLHGDAWERLFIKQNSGYVCGYHSPKWHWRRVTSEKIVSQLNAAVAEHIAAQEQK